MPPEMAGMAKRLKRVYDDRKERWGLTQKQLSEASGVSQSVISELMNEDLPPRDSVTAAVIVNLCLALEVNPAFVLIGDGDEIPRLARRSRQTGEAVDISEEESPLALPPPPPAPPRATPERTERTPGERTSESP